LFAAWIGRRHRLAISQVVGGIDAIDEDDARLGDIIGRAHQPRPQIARAHCAIDLIVEDSGQS
jgi:hypothetical protein